MPKQHGTLKGVQGQLPTLLSQSIYVSNNSSQKAPFGPISPIHEIKNNGSLNSCNNLASETKTRSLYGYMHVCLPDNELPTVVGSWSRQHLITFL